MIGLFIGSFNPPTKAHLDICLLLKEKFDKIIFVPVNSNNKHLIPIRDRINMLKFYTKKYSFLKIDDIMTNYSYLNYRIIDILNKKYNKITIIIGSDLLKKIYLFDNYKYLLDTYSFIVIKRDNDNIKKIIKEKYQDYANKFIGIDYVNNISSSIAREIIKNKDYNKDIIDKNIYDYIISKHFYV